MRDIDLLSKQLVSTISLSGTEISSIENPALVP
jgi:hypothetical protein